MIHHVIRFALRQRALILLMVMFVAAGGAVSFRHMPVERRRRHQRARRSVMAGLR